MSILVVIGVHENNGEEQNNSNWMIDELVVELKVEQEADEKMNEYCAEEFDKWKTSTKWLETIHYNACDENNWSDPATSQKYGGEV